MEFTRQEGYSPRRTVTFSLPSFSKRKIAFLIVALIILAIGYLFYKGFLTIPSTGLFLGQSNSIVYLEPINCGQELCNTNEVKGWADVLGYETKIYDTKTFLTPLVFLSSGSNFNGVSFSSKRNFYADICSLTGDEKACSEYSQSVEESGSVLITLITSYSPLRLSFADIRARAAVYDLQNNYNLTNLNIRPRFLIQANPNNANSLSSAELQEVMRQLCIITEQPQSYWTYAGCLDGVLISNKWSSTSWETCANSVQLDVAKLNNCVSSRGLDLAKNEYDFTSQNQIQSSPILFVNNYLYSGTIDSDSLFKIVCLHYSPEIVPASCK